MMLHLADAVKQGYTTVAIRTVDTDVVVLAVAAVQQLHNNITELWIKFGTGKNFRYLPIHEIAQVLGPERNVALLMFHAFKGCDTVSFFWGKGKKTAWDTWNNFDGVTQAFHALATHP